MLAIETIVHYTVNSDDDPHIKAFGVPFDAASPIIWALAAVLLIGGFFLARKTWTRVGQAWDDATDGGARKGSRTHEHPAIELRDVRKELRQSSRSSATSI